MQAVVGASLGTELIWLVLKTVLPFGFRLVDGFLVAGALNHRDDSCNHFPTDGDSWQLKDSRRVMGPGSGSSSGGSAAVVRVVVGAHVHVGAVLGVGTDAAVRTALTAVAGDYRPPSTYNKSASTWPSMRSTRTAGFQVQTS